MPTYEYECQDCKHRTVVIMSAFNTAAPLCEECGKMTRKVFGTPAVKFAMPRRYSEARAARRAREDAAYQGGTTEYDGIGVEERQ